MPRSLRASEAGIKQIRKAMKQGGFTQEALADALGISRSVITVLFRGDAIDKENFDRLCDFLCLDWKEIRSEEADNEKRGDDLDRLVQEVKQKIAADVTERCGTMRVLDMTEPVDLDRIYTDVNIIKDVIGRRRIGYDEVMEVCTREHFDRFLVGTIQKRVTGLEAVDEIQKLVVLGKPGAGKTTFMKYLAMSCLGNRFHGELVPIFVTLKAYAEERGQPSLENYILAEFAKRKVSQDVAKQLLDNGKALILLDGLDEVKKEDDRRVKQDIDRFSRDWLKNRFAITCRIAAREYLFENFTEVEVADFDDGQIETFVNNWFRERDESKAERLLERLKGNQPVKELAKSPLLLTLLCLVFGERNDFPPKRSELYKEGLEVLMKKWDAKRNIEREMIYKHLSPQNKEDMLGQIAFNTFVNGEYFFRQEDLQRQIKDYICNLPETSADPDVLRLDSEVVLKAIEHHHGLLVERARNIYSFSHLTFQEYFAAKAIERGQQLEILVQNISNPRWKEVFYLTAEMLWRSDDFLKMMKNRIDGMMANDEKLQAFLEWTIEKSSSVKTKYKIVAVRSYYTSIAFNYISDYTTLNPSIEIEALLIELHHSLDRLTCELDPNIFNEIELGAKSSRSRSYSNRERNLNLAREIDLARETDFVVDRDLSFIVPMANDIERSLNQQNPNIHQEILELSEYLSRDIENKVLQQELQILNEELPNPQDAEKILSRWFEDIGHKWKNKFRQLCITHRNLCHDWQFTDEQVELLEQYYAANLLLVECMNRSYVSKQVREEIETTMLLPSKK
jgi:predicted NACHT family NTPase